MMLGVQLHSTRVLVKPAGLSAQASSKHTQPFSTYVMKARHYIRQYGCQGIKNEQVAAYVGISRSTLEQRFREEVGSTVHAAMLEHRLEMAQQLLRNTNLPTTDVAQQAGFSSLQYMYAVFKRELDITPALFRHRFVMQKSN